MIRHSLQMAALTAAIALHAGAASAQDTTPAPGGDLSQGAEKLSEGARLLLRGLLDEMEPALDEMSGKISELQPILRELAEMLGDLTTFHPPERLPNGDVLLRRRVPEPPPLSEAPEEIEI